MTKQHDYTHRYINVAALTVAGSTVSTQVLTNEKRDAMDVMERWMATRRGDARIVACVIHDTLDNSTWVFSIADNYAHLVQGGK